MDKEKVAIFVNELNELVKKHDMAFQECCCAHVVDKTFRDEFFVYFDSETFQYVFDPN